MKVILTQDVRGKGKKGQMIEAAEGYARNYLIPHGIAVPATADAVNTMKLRDKAKAKADAEAKAAAEAIAEKLQGCQVKIAAKGGAEGKLFGAVTSAAIAAGKASQSSRRGRREKITLFFASACAWQKKYSSARQVPKARSGPQSPLAMKSSDFMPVV